MEYIGSKWGDWWVCLCGNEPDRDGFYPCDRDGRQVEPTPHGWDGIAYICERCGRIIDQRDLSVIGTPKEGLPVGA